VFYLHSVPAFNATKLDQKRYLWNHEGKAKTALQGLHEELTEFRDRPKVGDLVIESTDLCAYQAVDVQDMTIRDSSSHVMKRLYRCCHSFVVYPSKLTSSITQISLFVNRHPSA
jgi:hypothetical protein